MNLLELIAGEIEAEMQAGDQLQNMRSPGYNQNMLRYFFSKRFYMT
jgi:hypothetical protein